MVSVKATHLLLYNVRLHLLNDAHTSVEPRVEDVMLTYTLFDLASIGVEQYDGSCPLSCGTN